MSGPEELVEEGSFRVDRGRALDKLMRFQLADPGMYLLPWLRAAVASAPERIVVDAVEGGVEVRFDGLPFTEAELQDPYACLFDRRTLENSRNRDLAVGILSVLRLRPLSVCVFSGPAGERLRLKVETVEKESLEPSVAPGTGTVLRVLWKDGGGTRALVEKQLELLPSRCEASPVPILLQGTELRRSRRFADDVEGLYFEQEGVHGWLSVPPYLSTESLLFAYSRGIALNAALEAQLPLVQVKGYINDDEFALNASQTDIVRNARYKRTMELVAGQAEELIIRMARSQAQRFEKTARELEDGRCSSAWRDRLNRGAAAEQPSLFELTASAVRKALFGRSAEELARRITDVRWDARVTAWLRDAGRKLADYDKEAGRPCLKHLWEAPVYLCASGGVLSLRDIDLQCRRLGYVPFSRTPLREAALPFRPVWCTTDGEQAELAVRFKGQLRNIAAPSGRLEGWVASAQPAPAPASEAPARQTFSLPEGPAPTLERAGLADLLIRESLPREAGGPAGEVGLSAHPPEKNAKLYFFDGQAPAGFAEVESALRFEAACTRPVQGWDRRPDAPLDKELFLRLRDLARRTAEDLYQKLAAEYDPWKVTQRNQAVRMHLLDLLASPEPPAWSETLKLFDLVDAWLTRPQLLDMLAKQGALYAVQDRDKAALLPGKRVLVLDSRLRRVLAAVLPEAGLFAVPGAEGREILYQRLGPKRCSHPEAGRFECLLEKDTPQRRYHLCAQVEAADGEMAFPWGGCKAYVDGKAPASFSADGTDVTGMDLLYALIQRHGLLHDRPLHPARRLLLTLASRYLTPRSQGVPDRMKGAALFLDVLPMFRRPGGGGLTLDELGRRLEGGPVVLLEPGKPGPGDVVLDEAEADLARKLWPECAERLVRGTVIQARAAAIPDAAPVSRQPAFQERMLLTLAYRQNGAAVWFGMPEQRSQEPRRPAVFERGKPKDAAAALGEFALPAAVWVDLTEWRGSEPAALRLLVSQLAARFYLDAARAWPISAPGSALHDAACAHLLRVLELIREDASLFPGEGGEVRAALMRLPLLRTLSGATLTLAEFSEQAAPQRYACAPVTPVPAEDRLVPILQAPDAVARILGVKALRRYRAKTPSSAPSSAPAPKGGAALEDRLSGLFSVLRGRRGMKVSQPVSVFRIDLAAGGEPFSSAEDGWTLNARNPLVQAVLASGLSPDEQAAYLASICYTALNRRESRVTDEDDARFQRALTDSLARQARKSDG